MLHSNKLTLMSMELLEDLVKRVVCFALFSAERKLLIVIADSDASLWFLESRVSSTGRKHQSFVQASGTSRKTRTTQK